jgi:hypothetical protein
MSQPQPYFDTERDVDVQVTPESPRLQTDCLICGHHDEFGTITLRLAWWRSPEKITAIPRCLDLESCRLRVAANGEPWPLLEPGEKPGEKPAVPPRKRPTEPMSARPSLPSEPELADAPPTSEPPAPSDDPPWF